MRLRGVLVVVELLMILVSAKANSPAILADPSWSEERATPELSGVSGSASETSAEAKGRSESVSVGISPLVSHDKLFAAAYFDTLTILGANNECSDFFGGPEAAAEVFAKLLGKVQKNPLPAKIAMHMTGETIHVINDRTKSQYRLFDSVLINSNGPFYRYRAPSSLALLPGLGTFQANTKEVRVLMFLHELGHAVKGDDGNWLLPDDGKNDDLSRRNSRKIEDVCGKQIKALRNQKVRQ
jgi:hypothetical protein